MRNLILALMILYGLVANAQTLSQSQMNYQPPQNLLVNAGFEKGLSKWSYSGATPSVVTSGSNLLFDKASITFDATAASQYVQSALYTIPESLKGVPCTVSTYYKGGDANLTLQVLDGASTVLASQVLAAATYTSKAQVAFSCPTSSTIRWRVASTADAALVALDNAVLGANDTFFQVAQAEFAGSAYFPATINCEWQRTNTAVGAFGTDTDCPGPTIDTAKLGSWQTTDADLPRVTINNLPAGIYKVTVTGTLYGAGDWTMAVSDGTNTRGYASGSGNGAASFNPANVSTAWFEYSTSGNRTFEVYGSSSSGAISLANNANNDRITFMVERYPLQTETAIKMENADFGWTAFTPATNVTTNTTTSGKWRRKGDSADFQFGIDWSGAPSAFSTLEMDLPSGFLFDTTKILSTTAQKEHLCDGVLYDPAGGTTRYRIEGVYSDTNSIRMRFLATTGAIVYNNVDVTNTVPFSIINGSYLRVTCYGLPISGWSENLAAPQLINSVIAPYEGVAKIVWASIANTGTPTVTRQSGSWISSITDNGTGDMTINITPGTFSVIPTCVLTDNPNTDQGSQFQIYDNGTARSTTLVRLRTMNGVSTLTDKGVEIMCMGPR